MHNKIYTTSYHATNSESKGVSILISKNCPIQIKNTLIDDDGRFIFLKGKLYNKHITLANMYAPNKQQIPFFRNTLELLTTFHKGMLISGGDFNLALSPSLDTSSGSFALPYRALLSVKTLLNNLTLHDTWRSLHPNSKDFTFFSPPHNKYSRIDYLFLTQMDLESLTTATIDPMILSDPHPISITLKFLEMPSKSNIWRLDNSLLNDPETVNSVKSHLINNF